MTIQSYPPPISRPIFNSSDFEVVEQAIDQPFLHFPSAQGAMTFTNVEVTETLDCVQTIDAGGDLVADSVEVTGDINPTNPALIIGNLTSTINLVASTLSINSPTLCNSPLETTIFNATNGINLGVNSYITSNYSALSIDPFDRGFIKEGTYTATIGNQIGTNVASPVASLALTNGTWFITATCSSIAVGSSSCSNAYVRVNTTFSNGYSWTATQPNLSPSGTLLTQSVNSYTTILGASQNVILNILIRYSAGRWNFTDSGFIFRAVKIA